MDYIHLVLFCMVVLWQQSSLASDPTSTWHERIRFKRQADAPCIVPPNPQNGQYSIAGSVDAKPGQSLPVLQLTVTCDPGFRSRDRDIVYCFGGTWTAEKPTCVRHCRLNPHPSVRYLCPASSNGFDDGFRNCKLYEPAGTVVKPQCNEPNYHYTGGLKTLMRCTNEGSWNHVVFCTADCGRVTPESQPLILEGWTARRGEIPWHAGIYLKPTGPGEEYRLVCGGSIISTRIIISAAHCFWYKGRVRPVNTVAVAVGKVYSKWNHPDDIDVQAFNVIDIKIPGHYRDYATNYQADIAAVTLSAKIEFRADVRPVCVDLNRNFDRTQLRPGAIGKVAGWGYIDKGGTPSPILKVLDMPYVRVEQCIEESPETFLQLITNDKICAGYQNGSAVCRGDSGGGLVFPAMDRDVLRYYLRGIVSVAPKSDDECNAYARASFTRIVEHSTFIEENTILTDDTPINSQGDRFDTPQNIDPGNCTLPSYPDHGSYVVSGLVNVVGPGQRLHSFQITVACNAGYVVVGTSKVFCIDGLLSHAMPVCRRFCRLDYHESVTYDCESTSADGVVSKRPCGDKEPSGTVVIPTCRVPNYYSLNALIKMHCIDGRWDYIAICLPGSTGSTSSVIGGSLPPLSPPFISAGNKWIPKEIQ